jgi:nitrate reductase (NAD(P)H)
VCCALQEGDTIDVKGPFGKFSYEGCGNYTLNRVQGKAKYLSMVAGGSGVTPCFDVAREVLQVWFS